MPSATYALFLAAMRERKPIACDFDGIARELCPIILGHTEGREVALAYQFGGATSRGPLTKPDWRCLDLARITGARLQDCEWQSGGSHSAAQTCVKNVDFEVNSDSPYNPTGRL